jgi:7-cyano-7-deazaguanine reductase
VRASLDPEPGLLYDEPMNPKHLGQHSGTISQYAPELLEAFPRLDKRAEIGVPAALPFYGEDIWNAYEISWLNPKGKPMVALGEFRFSCASPNLIESKSLKLYLNSFNQSIYTSLTEVSHIIAKDLAQASGLPVTVILTEPKDLIDSLYPGLPGKLIDTLDIPCRHYQPSASLLKITPNKIVSEILTSDLLKSNCLVTGQPDWGSVQIAYTGPQISRESLLHYIVSFREHNEFHEQCVERIFMDIQRQCSPSELTVYARYTRRGGLDINPYRSTHSAAVCPNIRLVRQ